MIHLTLTSYQGKTLIPRPFIPQRSHIACGIGTRVCEFPGEFDRMKGFSTIIALEKCRFDNGQKLSTAESGSKWNMAHSFWTRNVQGNFLESQDQLFNLKEQAPEEVEILGNYLWTALNEHLKTSAQSHSETVDFPEGNSKNGFDTATKVICVASVIFLSALIVTVANR